MVCRAVAGTHGCKVVQADEGIHLHSVEELLDGYETSSLEGDTESLADEARHDAETMREILAR